MLTQYDRHSLQACLAMDGRVYNGGNDGTGLLFTLGLEYRF